MMYVMNGDIEPNFKSFMFPCDPIFGQVLRQIFTHLIRTCRSAYYNANFTTFHKLCDLL